MLSTQAYSAPTHEPSAAPTAVTNQPVALLVYPNLDNENTPASPQHVFVLPNCNLFLERNSPAHETVDQNRPSGQTSSANYGGEANVPSPSVRGLECLNGLSKIWIHQNVELFEILSNWEAPNHYVIKGPDGRQLFMVIEESDICARQCCGSLRPFKLHLLSPQGQKVVTIKRKFRCGTMLASCHLCCCCFWLCESKNPNRCEKCCHDIVNHFMQEITIETPEGELIGKVRQEPKCIVPRWSVLDFNENVLLQISGPHICFECCLPCLTYADRLKFKLKSVNDDAELGTIRKEWAGFMREVFTDADDFSVTFPPQLDSKTKALVLSAVFLLDFTYFENNHKQHS